MPRKSVAEKIAELKRKEAWKLIRKAEKLEAQAAAHRKAAELLEFQAQMEGPSVTD